jgi:hypothetical protein
MWDRIARLELDFCDLLHGGPTEKRLAVFPRCKMSFMAQAV